MRTIVVLALLLVVGFAGSRGLVARATHRLPLAGLFATGMEFFLAGMLLGPNGFDVITVDVLTHLEPIVYLALGWIGLLFGVELSWGSARRVSRRVYRFLFVDTVACVAVVAVLMYLVQRKAWPEWSETGCVVSAVVMGIAAAVGSPTIVTLVARRLPARGPLTNTMKIASALSALFPLLAFGVVFMVLHPRYFAVEGVAVGLLWWLFLNLVGLVLGLVLVLFTHEWTSDDELLLLIVGTVLLVGGVCYFLKFSSLYAAMVTGFVVGNLSRRRDQIFREVHVVEKTLYVGFLVLVGAMVGMPDWVTIAVAAAYVLGRLATKYAITGAAVSAGFPELRALGRRTGLALSGQGVMAMAIALDVTLASDAVDLQRTLTVVALAVLANAPVGLLLTRRVFIASGETATRRRVPAKPAEPS